MKQKRILTPEQRANQKRLTQKHYQENKAVYKERSAEWRVKNAERQREASKTYRKKNREKVNEQKRKYWAKNIEQRRLIQRESARRGVLKRCGATEEQYRAALEAQGYSCAICLRDEAPRGFVIDHCHKENKFRGVLCHNCNTALGHVRDDVVVLKAMITYLQR